MQRYDIIVVGAGVVGAAFSLALQNARVSVAVVEPQAPRPRAAGWDTRVYTISPGNANWLETLGAWQQLPAERVTRVENMDVFGDDVAAQLRFSAYDVGLRELAWTVEGGVLQDALSHALETSAHVKLFCPRRCADMAWASDHVQLELNDGETLAARLIVAADGAQSWVRTRAGIDAAVHDYHECGVVANFEAERSHEGTAFQWFREDGVLAFLPLPEQRVSIVWSTSEPHAAILLSASEDMLAREVTQASRNVLGSLRVITPAASFPLQRLRVAHLVEPRVALIGDSAHAVHPLAGQGLNLGLRDARALANVLCERGPREDCGEYALLRRYERARKEDMLATEVITDGLAKLFGSRAVWLAGMRNFGLRLVDLQPQLKNLLIRHAIA